MTLTGKPLLVAAVNQITQHPETWDQKTWHCGSPPSVHSLVGWIQFLGGWNSGHITKDARVLIDFTWEERRWLLANERTLYEIHSFAKRFINGDFEGTGGSNAFHGFRYSMSEFPPLEYDIKHRFPVLEIPTQERTMIKLYNTTIGETKQKVGIIGGYLSSCRLAKVVSVTLACEEQWSVGDLVVAYDSDNASGGVINLSRGEEVSRLNRSIRYESIPDDSTITLTPVNKT